MSVNLDDYEKEYLAELLIGIPHVEDGYVIGVGREVIELFDQLPEETDPDQDVFSEDGHFLKQLISFSHRSRLYEQVASGYFERHRREGLTDGEAAEAAHVVAPWLVQEFEGTIKHGLQMIAYLLEYQGDDVPPEQILSYVESRCMYLSDAISRIRSNAPEDGHLARLVSDLHPEEPGKGTQEEAVPINNLRRAIAHSDFRFHPHEPPILVLFDNDKQYEFTLSRFLEIFLRYENLAKVLNVTLHLGIRRLTGMPPEDATPGKLYGVEDGP